MIGKDSIETAYAFMHQKLRVYEHSTLDWQKDDILLQSQNMDILMKLQLSNERNPYLYHFYP